MGKRGRKPKLDPPVKDGHAWCRNCERELALNLFGPKRLDSSVRGYHHWCNGCKNEYQAVARNRAGRPFSWIVRGMQDRTIALTCDTCGELKMTFQMSSSGFRRCAACDSQRSAQYRAENPDRWRETLAKAQARSGHVYIARRGQRLAANGMLKVSAKDIRRLRSSCCARCGSGEQIQLDHVIPVARGGRDSVGNLQPLCRSCNASKADRLMVEWRYGRKAQRPR